jgi:predicted DCC family thiol-disulfide oxidoreductase YuxK
MKTWRLLVILVLFLAWPVLGQTVFPALGREIETLVRDRFYDSVRAERWATEGGKDTRDKHL